MVVVRSSLNNNENSSCSRGTVNGEGWLLFSCLPWPPAVENVII